MRGSRSQTTAATSDEPTPVKQLSQKVLLVPDCLTGCDSIETVQLRHPATNSASMFLLGSCGKDVSKIAELKCFDEGHRSWFIDDTVQSDGRLFIATKFNPIYIVLPYLVNAEKLVPLDQLLEDEQFSRTPQLCEMVSKSLDTVADAKGQADLNVWKYNEEKTLIWLEKKTKQLFEKLMEEKVPTSTAQALTFVRTMDQDATKEAYLELAWGIISEYLPEVVSLKLRSHLNLPDQKIKKPLKPTSTEPPSKKSKSDPDLPTDDYTNKAVPVKKEAPVISAKAKALAKSAAGNKSILSFFGKKSSG